MFTTHHPISTAVTRRVQLAARVPGRSTFTACAVISAIVLVSAAATGCSRKGADKPVDAKQVEAQLVKADAYDGTEDKIVASCANCRFGMDGTDSHVVEAHGYKMHFCSDSCRKAFATDTDAKIVAMVVPEKSE